MKEAKYSPVDLPALVDILTKAIGRYLCTRACDYAGSGTSSHFVMDTEDLSDVFMIDTKWIEDHKADIYKAAWHDPMFMKYIKIGRSYTPDIFAFDVVKDIDKWSGDELYERMEMFLDIWIKKAVGNPKIDLEELRDKYKGFDIEDGERCNMLRYDLKCAILARKILLKAAEESNRDGQATFDIDDIPLPWTDFDVRIFNDPVLIDQFNPGKESEVARCMREDAFLSKYLLMYEVRDFDEEERTGWLDIQIGTELAEWENGIPAEGEADCRYLDATENYRRAITSFELRGWKGTYDELLAIYEYLQTPTDLVATFDRVDRENRRKHWTPKKIPCNSGRYPWPKDVATELEKGTESSDPVNHPNHYAASCSLECIDVMELIFDNDQFAGYLLCNAFKYLWRHKHKGGTEDLRKAKWYLDKFAGDQTAYDIARCDLYPKLRDMLVKQAGGEVAVRKL